MPSWTFRLVAPLGAAALLAACGPWAGAEPVPPSLVALIVDTSGSVGPEQLARGRVLAEGLLKGLPAGSEVAVFSFDDASRLLVPRTSSADEVRRRLASLKIAGRHSALYDALYDASRYLRDAPGTRRAIVLITDGRDEGSALNLDDGLRVALEARIPVHVVAVGRPDARVLRRIAKLTGGSYAPLRDVRLAGLASQLRNPPADTPPRAAPEADARSAPPMPAAATGASARPGTAAQPRTSGAATSARSTWPWILTALFVVAAGAAVVLALRSRRSEAIASPTLSPAGSRLPRPRAAPAREDDLSPTVLARMNLTEEYLEKTVTLRPRPILSITKGADAGQVVELSETTATSLGRAKANDLVVNDVAVSSQHCRIRSEDGRFVLHDLKSTNGTFVNERRVTSQPLAEGDVIKVGETHIQFRLDLKRS